MARWNPTTESFTNLLSDSNGEEITEHPTHDLYSEWKSIWAEAEWDLGHGHSQNIEYSTVRKVRGAEHGQIMPWSWARMCGIQHYPVAKKQILEKKQLSIKSLPDSSLGPEGLTI